MNCIKVSEAAAKWNISARRVRILCEQNRIAGVTRKGNLYLIPDDAPKPSDARSYAKKIQPKIMSRSWNKLMS